MGIKYDIPIRGQSFIIPGTKVGYNWERYEDFSKDNWGMKLSEEIFIVVV